MPLTGVSPSDPRPAIRREFVFGAGPGAAVSPDRPVVLWGNKTSAGSATADTLTDPIVDEADALAKGGAKSEIYQMYRKFCAVPQQATIYFMCPTESGGTAASVNFTVTNASDATSTVVIEILGEVATHTIQIGDSTQITAEAIAAVINDMDEGRLMLTASTSDPGGGPWTLTLTASQKGPRFGAILGSSATLGARIRFISHTPATNAQTISKGALSAGTTEDDWTAAITAMANEEIYYHVSAKSPLTTVTSTDNGIGEHMTMIKDQAAPINGKDQRLIFACISTNANAIAVAVSSAMNSAYATMLWAENSDWHVAMIAAHYAGVIRQQEITHPGANINGWTASDSQKWDVPKPYNKSDYPTATEVINALNNGVTPLTVKGGRTYIERHITTKSLNTLGNNDYRTREGNIPSCAHFFWSIARQEYEARRQPFADYDPPGTAAPAPRTQTPSMVKAMIEEIITDLSSPQPRSGQYDGPILAPSKAAADKLATTVSYDGKGGFPTFIPIHAVQHNIKWESVIAEQSAAY